MTVSETIGVCVSQCAAVRVGVSVAVCDKSFRDDRETQIPRYIFQLNQNLNLNLEHDSFMRAE